MKFKLLITLLALINTPSLFAPFYRGSIWSRVDEQGQEHFVYCFGDEHMTSDLNKQQRAQLPEIFRNCGIKDIHVTVEDKANAAGVQWSTSPLYNLTELCQSHNIATNNIEFRLAANNTMFHIRQSIARKDQRCAYLTKEKLILNLTRVLNEYNEMEKLIFSYEDPSNFKAIYEKFGNSTVKHAKTVRTILAKAQQFQEDQTLSYIEYCELGDALILLENPILDIECLHSLYNNKKYKHNFIFVGGAHAQNIEQAMPGLGFTKVKQYGPELETDDELKDQPIDNESEITIYLDLQKCFDEFFAQYPQALAPKKDTANQSLGVSASFVAASLNAGGPFAQEPAEADHSTKPETHYKQPHQPNKARHSQLFRRNFSTAPCMHFGKPTQLLPMTGKVFAPHQSPSKFTFGRLTSSPFKFAAVGLAGLSALGAYALFGR